MILISILIWNIVVFFVYGTDKLYAKNKSKRIKESTLILCAFLFGSVGAMSGMMVFHHKTKKTKFKILVPAAFIFNVAVAVIMYTLLKGMWD
ncbi:MAG: DUF1294 domain-containing protein [Clostridia bacterium]|nr:DUF1294 domain-containing protein [Clostridia bacterium]